MICADGCPVACELEVIVEVIVEVMVIACNSNHRQHFSAARIRVEFANCQPTLLSKFGDALYGHVSTTRPRVILIASQSCNQPPWRTPPDHVR
jgi:hypothetical protein